MADRFTAEELRALAKDRPGVIGPMLSQAADTEEKVEKIASADPALVEAIVEEIMQGIARAGGRYEPNFDALARSNIAGDVLQVFRALAAVLKGEAHE